MFIDKDSIIINGISMGYYLTEVEYQYNKIWGSDSGRNLAGTQTGTLIGIFPKLILNFRRLKKEELNLLAPIFDSAYQNVTYYDPSLNRDVTMQTYTGDWNYNSMAINHNEGLKISFIATKKRGA